MGYVKQFSGKLFITNSRRGETAKFQQDGATNSGQIKFDAKMARHDKKDVFKYEDDGKVVCIALRDGDKLVENGVIFGQMPAKVDEVVKLEVKPDKIEDRDIERGSTEKPFNIQKSWLPQRTKDAVEGITEIDNFHLKFYKAARFDRTSSETGNGDEKFQTIISEKKELQYLLRADFSKINFPQIAARTQRTATALGFGKATSPLLTLQAESCWRWIVGLGNASPYENGMTLHHVYGIPYIPGSGVKGMLRTWIIQECFGRNEDLALSNSIFQHIFGYPKLDEKRPGRIGQVVFFDAFPTEKVSIEPDIMNNHFQDYYEGNAPPADWLQPNPIFFMTAVGGKLEFNLGLKTNEAIGEPGEPFWNNRENGLSETSSLEDLLRTWLQDALENHGIGAKTAVGYGRFQTLQPQTETP